MVEPHEYQLVEVVPGKANTNDSDEPPAKKDIFTSNTHTGTPAINKKPLRAVINSFVHLVPVAITAALLQLSIRNIYWRGTYYKPTQTRDILAVLQIAAKFHEISITTSLSFILLYHLRAQLFAPQGLPHGIFTTAYGVVLGGHPVTSGLWHSLRSVSSSGWKSWRSLLLIGLALTVSALGLFVGPASATVMIPTLDWWEYRDLFALRGPVFGNKAFTLNSANKDSTEYGDFSDFEMYIPQQLFPKIVNSSSLPADSCMDSSLDKNSTCPYSGLDQLLRTLIYTTDTKENVTIDNRAGRKLSSYKPITASMNTCWTWTSNQVISSYLATVTSKTPLGLEGDWTIEGRADRASMDPVVKTTCAIGNSTSYNITLGWGMRNPDTDDPNHPPYFDIREIWNTSILANSPSMLVEWRDLDIDATWPVLSTFIYTPAEGVMSATVTVCKTQSFMYPSRTWIATSDGVNILSNFTWEYTNEWDVYHTNPNPAWRNTFKKPAEFGHAVRIQTDWANTFNAKVANSTSTIIKDYLKNGTKSYWEKFPQPTPRKQLLRPYSILLSRAIADGLARIGSAYRLTDVVEPQATSCRRGWCSSGKIHTVLHKIYNVSMYDAASYWGDTNGTMDLTPVLTSFPKPANADDIWTNISFPMQRYGYGWSFNSTTMILATVVLVIQAVVVFAHIVWQLLTRDVYEHMKGLEDIVDVALKSDPPAFVMKKEDKGYYLRSTAVKGVQDPDGGMVSLRLRIGQASEHDEGRLEDVVVGKKYI